jgi:hypothetical protein
MEQSPIRRWRRLRLEPLEDRRLLATLTVNSASDVTLAGDGLVSLREAIAAANANTTTDLGHTGSGADTIVFDPVAFATPQTLALTQGEMAIAEALAINGPGRDLFTIDGQLQSRIFNITATTGDFTLAGMTLTRGKTTGEGGAIRSLADLTVAQSTISGNVAVGSGGGIYIHRNFSGGSLSVTDCIVSGNSSVTGSGGGIYSAANFTLAGSTISGNTVPNSSAYGGGIVTHGPTATVTSSTISGNNGGRAALYFGGSNTLSLLSSTISGNSHRGVYAQVQSVTLTDCTVTNNGGVGAFAYDLTVVDSIVTGDELSGNNLNVTGTTVTTGSLSGNDVALTHSTINGGGIYGYHSVTLTDSTITGGGITTEVEFLFGDVTLNNSTITGSILAVNVELNDSSSGSIDARGDYDGNFDGDVTLTNSSVIGSVTSRYGNVTLQNSTVSAGISTQGNRGGSIDVQNSTVSVGIGKSNRSAAGISLRNSIVYGGISIGRGNVSLASSTVTGSSGIGIRSVLPTDSGLPSLVTLTNSTVSNCNGNGIFVYTGSVSLTNSTVSGNTAIERSEYIEYEHGGGIRAQSVTLINSTVSGNSAEGNGGGIWAYRVTVKYSTITGNHAEEIGGGVFAYSNIANVNTISSSIIAGNTTGSVNPDLRFSAGTLAINYSLIGDKAGTSLTEAQTPDANGNLIGNSAGGGIIDPLLAPLADNGGPTETHALLPGSLAIDAKPYVVVDPELPTPTHDYQLNSSLTDALGGPSLVALGGTLTASGYQFGSNQGLNLSSALVDPADYSIELVFSWTSLSGGWQKIIDFHNLVSDVGLYTLGNGLQFMNGAFAPNLFTAGVARHLVLTRDDATNVVRAYIDGVERWNFVDNAGDAVFDGPNDIIRFFQDDTASGQTEAQSGFADRIRIFDGALSATDVAALFNPPPPPPPDVPPNDQRGEPFARIFNDAIDMGAFELQPPAYYGDFNDDRSIDAADYVAYRKFLGSNIPSYRLADSDGDGSITPADDDPWERNFGSVLDVMPPPASAGSVSAAGQSVADDAVAPNTLPAAKPSLIAATDEALALPDIGREADARDMPFVAPAAAVRNIVDRARLLHMLDGPHEVSAAVENRRSPAQLSGVDEERDAWFAGLDERLCWSVLSALEE